MGNSLRYVTCERCGVGYEYLIMHQIDNSLYLCPSCYQRFIDWLNQEPIDRFMDEESYND